MHAKYHDSEPLDQLGVSKISGTPKWMVYNGSKPYEQMDDLGGPPLFLETSNFYRLKSID